MKKIPKKYHGLMFGILMSLIMSVLMTSIITLINIGIVPNFWQIWTKAFIVGIVVGFPAAMVAIYFVNKILNHITE